MRTTLNIDDEIYHFVKSLALANRQSVSRTVDHLLSTALQRTSSRAGQKDGGSDPLTGFPVFRSKRSITEEDVNSLLNEE